jgi:CheY-like chemotaxis protein
VVDDNASSRAILCETLEGWRMQPVAFEGGLAALAALRPGGEGEPPFALALVDVRMPDMDGIEVTRRIKASHPETVVVLISAQDPTGLSPAVESCGAVALVRKQELGAELLRRLWREHGESRSSTAQ